MILPEPPPEPPPAVRQLPPGREGLRNETLLMTAPEGMKVGASGRPAPDQRMMEFVPADETVEAWTRMVTAHIVYRRSNVDPDLLPSAMASGWTSGCPGGDAKKIAGAPENGYPTSIWMFRCPLNAKTGKPEAMFVKTISGGDSLYDVQYAYRALLTPELITPAMRYLKGVGVCDTRTPEHPCPAVRPPDTPSAPSGAAGRL